MKSIGLDIGTTTICGIVIDNETGKLVEVKALPNESNLEGKFIWEKHQDANKIWNICNQLIDTFIEQYDDIDHIGLTGQMHGILYVDETGEAITPLITWQDGRGNQVFSEGLTYSSFMSEKTGYLLATGYGLVTHYYNQYTKQIPSNASTFCTIADYIAMKLAHISKPLLHKSMAASLGCFLMETDEFDYAALMNCGVLTDFLPDVAKTETILGMYKEQVKVSIALGDNQASFLGSVNGESNILINIGTGSQISIFTKKYDPLIPIEYRPYLANTYLMVGAALCGGDAYALLRTFFKQVLDIFHCEYSGELYDCMNQAAEKGMMKDNQMKVTTCFNGTRHKPGLRGKIDNLGMDNFTPEGLTFGVLQGMCNELYDIYEKLPEELKYSVTMTGSGNGIRKNTVLQKICQEVFGKKLVIPSYAEEAAYGSALFSLLCSGYFHSLKQMQDKISTERENVK